MLADPQTVTINAVAQTLARTGATTDHGVFRSTDGLYTLHLDHAYGKRTRRTVRLDYKVTAADVMDSSLNVPYSASVYTVLDAPNVGITPTTQVYLLNGMADWMKAGLNALGFATGTI